MLQRKVPKAAVFLFGTSDASIPAVETYDFCNNFEPSGFDFHAKVSSDIADKFGYSEHSIQYDYSRNQVFQAEDLGKLMCALQKKKTAKQPVVARETLLVRANEWWGI